MTTPSNKSLCSTLLFTTLIGLVLVASVNIIVDPTDVWGTDMLKPLVRTSRKAKVQLLTRMTPAPKTLILGSSRVMKFEPTHLAKYSPGPVFNASVNSAMTEDYLAMAKLAIEAKTLPVSHIVLGVDVEAFSPGRPIDARLMAMPALARQLDPSVVSRLKLWFERWTGVLSFERLKLARKSVGFWLKGYPELSSTYLPDGLLTYIQWEAKYREGKLDTVALLNKTKGKYERRLNGYTHLDVGRKDYFQAFVQLCKAHNVTLTVFMTPLHPELEAHLQKALPFYDARMNEVHSYLEGMSRTHQFQYKDTRALTVFGGSPEAYFDGAHPMVTNTRRHIDYLYLSKGKHAL